MSIKKWIDLDIDELELEEVTELERNRVKQHILTKKKKTPIWRRLSVAAILLVSATAATTFTFPSLASQIPFMDNVIRYFEEDKQYAAFEQFSNEIGLVQTSNGTTVMIDNAVYDGTNVIVSYAIETTQDLGEFPQILTPNWFDAVGAVGLSASGKITKISDHHYVGIADFSPSFKNNQSPETIEITWEPKAFYNPTSNAEVRGDWSFAFSLQRLAGDLQLINETVKNEDVGFTLTSIEYTDVSTVFSYNQTTTEGLRDYWESITPVFTITDNLGNEYINGTGGAGSTSDNFKSFKGTTSFGAVHKDAAQLIIQPTIIPSLNYGKGHEKISLDPIIIEIEK